MSQNESLCDLSKTALLSHFPCPTASTYRRRGTVPMSDFAYTGPFAEVYDRYLVPMDFAPYARRLADRVSALALRRVLGTAAGTGVVTRELARILPSRVTITATDLNNPQIDVA